MRGMDPVIVHQDSTEQLVVKSAPPAALATTVCNSASAKTEPFAIPKTAPVNAPQDGRARNATKPVPLEPMAKIVLENATVRMACTVTHRMGSVYVRRERKDTNVKRLVSMGCLVQVARGFVRVRMEGCAIRSRDLASVELDGGGRSVIDLVRMGGLERGAMRFVIVLRQTTPPSTTPSSPAVTMSPASAVAQPAGQAPTVKPRVP